MREDRNFFSLPSEFFKREGDIGCHYCCCFCCFVIDGFVIVMVVGVVGVVVGVAKEKGRGPTGIATIL